MLHLSTKVNEKIDFIKKWKREEITSHVKDLSRIYNIRVKNSREVRPTIVDDSTKMRVSPP